MEKKSFTLIEVIFFTLLSALLIGAMLKFFVGIYHFEKKNEASQMHLNKKEYMQVVLSRIFSQLQPPALQREQKHPLALFTKELPTSLALYLFFDHGIDPETKFSGPVCSRLFLDENKNLILDIWPSSFEKKTTSIMLRREILYKKVEKILYEFVGKNQKNELVTSSLWSENEKNLPQMMLITLIFEDSSNLLFPFFLSSNHPIIFPSKEKK